MVNIQVEAEIELEELMEVEGEVSIELPVRWEDRCEGSLCGR